MISFGAVTVTCMPPRAGPGRAEPGLQVEVEVDVEVEIIYMWCVARDVAFNGSFR